MILYSKGAAFFAMLESLWEQQLPGSFQVHYPAIGWRLRGCSSFVAGSCGTMLHVEAAVLCNMGRKDEQITARVCILLQDC